MFVQASHVALAREIPAFPGAEGSGAKATGGRRGRVITVTNLDDSGPGSLRAALDEKGPRTVVFRVSGTISLKSGLKIRHGDLTLAGQRAPGDGICLKDYNLDISGARNVIVRYLRIRPGDASGKGLDALGGSGCEDVIVDHCSVSWSVDECVSFYRDVRKLTVQWCLISESLSQSVHEKGGPHGFGGIWGGTDTSWHHNLLAHHSSRNPRIPGGQPVLQSPDLRNNVIYNWSGNSCYGGDGEVRVNLINNYYKPGPATGERVRSRIANPSKGAGQQRWWLAGNFMAGAPEVTADNWLGLHPNPGDLVEDFLADGPLPAAPVTTQPAEAAYELVLKHAGTTLPRRDSLDARIVEEVRTGTAHFGETYGGGGKGIIDSPQAAGGWPELRSTDAPPDSDSDGMPDVWETKFGFDPKTASDNSQDKDGDGYTNLEEYLNGTDPSVFIDYTKAENNISQHDLRLNEPASAIPNTRDA